MFAGLLLANAMVAGGARGATDAGAFLTELSDRAIVQMTEPGITEAEKERRFRLLIDEGFDIPAIGKFVIGRYWRGASPAEQQGFLATFKDMMVQRFLPVFAEYSGERLSVNLVRPFAEGSHIFSVSSELKRPQAEPFKVDWRVLQSDGGYKIVDIIAEGVSIAVTLRSEYTSVLKNNGGSVEALTSLLKKKIVGG
jgi:phospholipid transport system substrate-binding protein